jgi:hypothetical protein
METRHAATDEQARYRNGDEAAHWLVHEERYERMLAPSFGTSRSRRLTQHRIPRCGRRGLPSIALHLDLTNHGQVPKLRRRTR